MKPWLQRQLKEPIVFLQVPFPQASLSHSFMSRKKKGQRERALWLTERETVLSQKLKSSWGCTAAPRRGWNVLADGISALEKLRWGPTPWKSSVSSWHMGGGKMRTWELDRNFILFASQILHPCHFAQIFPLENGKASACIWTFTRGHLWHTSAFRVCSPSYPKVTHQASPCSQQQNSTLRLPCHFGHVSFSHRW